MPQTAHATILNNPLLNDLNPAQREAVTFSGRYLLVLAGAGSGKTRVLTRRAAWLVHQGVSPGSILAVTFTRKAAEELSARLQGLLGSQGKQVFTSTFHAFGAWLLRQCAPLVGREHSFSIFDADDSEKAVSAILKERGLERPGPITEWIRRVKHQGSASAEEWLTEIYKHYEERLKTANALDFDDLIRLAVHVLEEHPGLRRSITERFRHVLVDEYQDLTGLEHRLVASLTSPFPEPAHRAPRPGGIEAPWRTFTAAGDDDQRIFTFRYADPRPLLEFERHFPGGVVIDAAVNYRCTPEILGAAGSLIDHNQVRRPKILRTPNPSGPAPEILGWAGDREEAQGLVERFQAAIEASPSITIAVLSRVHALLRPVAQACLAAGLPVHLVHEIALHERKEIKDILAFCRAALNPEDWAAHQRALVVPPRGIGPKRLAQLELSARSIGVRAALKEATRRLPALSDVLNLLDLLGSPDLKPSDGLRAVIDRIGYRDYLARTLGPDGAASRLDHLDEILQIAQQWEATRRADLRAFLDAVTLSEPNGAHGHESIQCLTLHAAKGLEWDIVAIVGLEEGFLPHYRQTGEDEIEEERRLCYVGMTRARQALILSCCQERSVWGERRALTPSRFLDEVGQHVLG